MEARDAIRMLDGAELRALGPTTWADLGSGDGTFTRALASLLSPGSLIHAVDLDAGALRTLPSEHHGVGITTQAADMTTMSAWPGRLDGLLMANSLHYVRDQEGFVGRWVARLSPARRFLIVEYDTDAPSPWVPYPVSRARLPAIFAGLGPTAIRDLGRRASIYRRSPLYAALVTA